MSAASPTWGGWITDYDSIGHDIAMLNIMWAETHWACRPHSPGRKSP